MTAQVVELAADGRRRAVSLLADAFRDNPLNRAVVGRGEARRLRSNRYGMRAAVAAAWGRGVLLSGRVSASGPDPANISPEGVLLAMPPGCFPLPAPSLFEQLRALAGQRLRIAGRWAEVYRALEVVHPVVPHWYLSLLGVAPAMQKRGLGATLLETWLDEVDPTGQPSYLETDRERNVAFYGRAGFEVQTEIRVLGVSVWCMWRPARSGPPEAEAPPNEERC